MYKFIFAVLFLSFIGQADNQRAFALEPPSLEDFLSENDFWGAELSPSGRYLSGVRNQDDRNFLVTFDLSDIESTALATDMGNASLNWVEWVTDDRLLLSITTYVDYRSGKVIPREDWGNPEKYIFPISVIRIVAMDRDGNNPVYMFGEDRSLNRNFYLGGVVSFLPQDPEHILMAARRGGDLDLFKLSVTDGSSERIAEGTDNTYRWFVDREGEPAFRYNTNNRGTVIYIYTREDRKNGKIKWRKTKTIRLNRNKQGDAATEFSPLSPGPEDTTYYVAARPEGEDKTGIYLYDFENDEFLETVRVHERLDIERGFFNRDTKELQGVWYHDDELVIEYTNPKVQRHMDGLEKYFGKGINVVPMMSNRAGDVWLVRTYGPTDAGSYHIYDLNQTKARELGSNKTVFRSRVFGEAQVIEYTARDGLTLRGYLTRPANLEQGRVPPLIMMPHGGPEVRDTLTFNYDVQVLVAHGYQVFQPNFRGSSGYGMTFANLGRREWGGAMQDDLDDGLDHLVAEGLVDPGRACIVGTSYGGYAALAAATMTPELYQCVVAIAAPSDLVAMLKWERKEEGRDSESYQYWVNHIGDPRKDKAALQAVSPAKLADRVLAPILLIHGTDDGVVPIKQSEIMVKALSKAGKAYQFVELEDSAHSRRSDEDQRLEYETILAFLGTHLPVAED